MAYMPCRKRKTRCDGAIPCSTCKEIRNTPSECNYDATQDGRRNEAQQERTNKERMIEYERGKRDRDTIINLIRRGSKDNAIEIAQLIRETSKTVEPHRLFDQIVQRVVLQEDPRNSQPLPSGDQVISLSLSDLYKFQMIRQYRQYQESLTKSHPWISDEDLSTDIPGGEVRQWTTVTSDTDLIDHLLALYFTWSHPFYLLFSEDIFYHGMRMNKAKYCTPLLMNAILAVGCCYSDRPETRRYLNDADTAGDHFWDEARHLLDEVKLLGQSSLTTVQALGLMSLRETMRNRDASAREYIAQMTEMVKRLELHVPPQTQLGNSHAPGQVEVHRITFWGCFVLETSSALSNGRISSLHKPAIGFDKPMTLPEFEFAPWRPYGALYYNGEESEMVQASRKYAVLAQLSLLSEIVDDITILLHASEDRAKKEDLHRHHQKLQKWFRDLPAELKIQTVGFTLPQIIVLHCYYHHCVIRLFRSPLMASFLDDTNYPTPTPCLEAAVSISQLMNIYSRTYGLEKSFPINSRCLTSAALVHCVSLDAVGGRNSTDQYLAQGIRGLYEMRAGQSLKVIQDLLNDWICNVPDIVQRAVDDCLISDLNNDEFGVIHFIESKWFP